VFDFEEQYKHKVVDYMIDEFKAGRTPNPDIMCNQEVKFKLFLETCLEEGADLIATGHYARVSDGQLRKAKDANKDQTYFLYRVTEKVLQKTLFPLGELTKPEVRQLAQKFGLVTATKKESMGICFVGKVGIKEFLSQYVTPKPGDIIDETGNVVGQHDGAIFYTIGQRSGLGVGGGLPYYVTGKDMQKNQVYVTRNLDDTKLWYQQLSLTDIHWINEAPVNGAAVMVRTRHRAPLVKATLDIASSDSSTLQVVLRDEIRAATPGQSAVLYDGDRCIGGGIVN
jgi:tRNA-specific 2-thiouridylase